ncbi:MAG: N-6 DNA methylase, partial [Leptolyngbyaceae cyanobacterium bins.59]|nr:N-6 DNA methylase [Leptolyngbyaceae cyanobacterium bins.59]
MSHSPNEAWTRKELIDPKLEAAGWDLSPAKGEVRFEIPVDGYDAEPWNGVTDYCLYRSNGEVIAVVEAKKQSRDPRVAEQQVRHYVTEIAKHQSFQPFAFLTYILEQHTSPKILQDEKGQKHLVGDRLSSEQSKHLQTEALTAYDNDSGMTMLRIGSMNLMLHGIQHPRFFYKDTLSKAFNDEKSLDVVLMNPPFKGKMDESDINPSLPTKVKKTELLFLHLILRVLDMGGRCAVIVPDG